RVLALAAWTERGISSMRGFVLFECSGKLRRRLHWRLGNLHHASRGHNAVLTLPALDQCRSLADVPQQLLLRRQVLEAGNAPQRPHPARLQHAVLEQHPADLRAPKAETAVLLERRNITQNRAVIHEERLAPLDLFH